MQALLKWARQKYSKQYLKSDNVDKEELEWKIIDIILFILNWAMNDKRIHILYLMN